MPRSSERILKTCTCNLSRRMYSAVRRRSCAAVRSRPPGTSLCSSFTLLLTLAGAALTPRPPPQLFAAMFRRPLAVSCGHWHRRPAEFILAEWSAAEWVEGEEEEEEEQVVESARRRWVHYINKSQGEANFQIAPPSISKIKVTPTKLSLCNSASEMITKIVIYETSLGEPKHSPKVGFVAARGVGATGWTPRHVMCTCLTALSHV